MAKGGALLRRWVQKAHVGSNPTSSADVSEYRTDGGILTGAFAAALQRALATEWLENESYLLRLSRKGST